MAIPNPSVAQTHEAFSSSDVRQLYHWNHLLKGSPGLVDAVTLFRRTSIFVGHGADADLTQLAAVAFGQAAVLGWKRLREVDWDKAWLPPEDGAGTSLLSHLRQGWIVDLVLGVTWNLREDLLCKNYFRFLRREVCYPYKKETKNEWFTAVITRQEDVDGKNAANTYEIKVLNSTDKNGTEISEEERKYLELESEPGYWFHGTCQKSAVNILEEGIKLKKGMPKQDFSNDNGFYMSPKFTCAKYWALKTKQQAAVIVFNVRKLLDDETFQKLDLTGSDQAANWVPVVKYNRCGRKPCAPLSGALRTRFDMSDYIIGPMSGGPQPKCPSAERNCKIWWPQIDSKLPDQLCIRTERLAEVFGSLKDEHIKAVVFYGE